LDDPKVSPLPEDSLSMWDAVAELPEQLALAVTDAAALEWDPPSDAVRNVVVLGVGASGFAGDVLVELTSAELAVPLAVVKSASVPAFVGSGSLVFAVSSSGDTAATVAAAGDCLRRGATLVAITSGGALAALAADHGAPVLGLPTRSLEPEGDMESVGGAREGVGGAKEIRVGVLARAVLGATTAPTLVLLERAGLLEHMVSRLAGAAGYLEGRRDLLVGDESPAAAVARRIGRTFPLVHGTPGPAGAAAQRWKMQVNANAKCPAFWSRQPELSFDEIVGWGQHGDITRQVLTMVTLRHAGEPRDVARRCDLVADRMLEVMADVVEVRSDAGDDVTRFYDLAMFGDFVSLHLAGQEGVDPGPAPIISDLNDLAQER